MFYRRTVMLVLVSGLAAAVVSFATRAEGGPVTTFLNNALWAYKHCADGARDLTARSLQLRQNLDVEVFAASCAKARKESIKDQYSVARNALASRPEAMQLLKDFYALWLSSIDAAGPDMKAENSRHYFDRIQSQGARLDEKANRLRIEL